MAPQRLSRPTARQQRHAAPNPVWQPHVQKHPLLQLQQTVGNQAFQQLLRSGVVQANFAVSQPGERQEQVAEQMAQLTSQVVRLLRRQPVEQEETAPFVLATEAPPPMPEVAPAMQGRNDAVRRGGQPTRPADSATASAPLVKKETEALPAVAGVAEESAAEAATGEETLQSPAPPEKAPASPEEDAAYQAVVAQVAIKAQQGKIPPKKPEQKQTETTLAAELPPEKITKQNAYDTHLKAMEQVRTHERTHELTVDQFIAEFKATSDELAKKLPENKEKHGTVLAIVEYTTEKTKATQAVAKQNKAYSDPLRTEVQKAASEFEKKTQETKTPELTVDPAGSIPAIKDATTAAPKPKTEDEISLDDHSRALDDALLNHNVSGQKIDVDEGSLAFPVSGEKTFDEAGEAKRQAQDEIAKAKPRYREKEMAEISKAQDEVQSLVGSGLQGFHRSRSQRFDAVLDTQKKHEGNIEREKGNFFDKFQKIYEKTKNLVNNKLSTLSGIEENFENILRKAEERFNSLVKNDLEYIYTPGFFDYSDWKDKHEHEIKIEFEKLLSGGDYSYHERLALQMKAMRIVQDRSALELFRYAKWEFIYNVTTEVREQIANKVVETLQAAKKDIKDGEDQVNEAYKLLSPKEQEEATQVFEAVKGQFQTLKESVEDRRREIINDMARTYNKSVGKLQATFDAIKKDVLTSWFEKAWNKLKAIVNAIIDFATRIAELLGRMISLLGDIISSPRYFFNNLVTGIGQGFSTFADRIDEFLATAFFDWLRGASGMPIQLPTDWGAKGIFSLFTQLLNLSTETIWERMEIVYDKTTANAFRRGEVLLDKGLEIFRIIKNEGLGGLWDHIKESLGNILEDTLGMIKETVLYAAIKKVIIEIGKMLVPGGGFIAIAEKIIRLLQFIVEARNKILDLIESFVNSMENAVKGDIPGIVKRITGALTKFITIALDFLVTFFGLGGLKEKVERFIERMRKPIIRGIDWMLGKVKPFVMKATTKGKELIAKGKALVAKGKAALGLDIDKQVILGKEKHTLRGHIEDDRVTILMSSNNLVDMQRQVDVIKTEWVQRLGDPERAKQLAERFEDVKTTARNFQKELVQISRQNKEKAQDVLDDNLSTLDNALEQIADDFGFAELMQVEVKKDDLIVDMNEGSWWVVKLMNVKVVNERKKPSFGIQAVKYTDPDQEKLFRYDEYTKTWGPAGSSQEPGSFNNPFEFNEEWPKPASDKYPTLYFGGETTETISQKDLEKRQGQEYPPGSTIKVKPYTPHGIGRLPGGHVIGLKQVHHGWHLKVGTKVGPLQPTGVTTPGGYLIVDILSRYGFNSAKDKLQGDHVHEIQVGGENVLGNLWPLDKDINEGAGRQINLASVHYPHSRGAEKISDLKKTTAPPNKYWFIINKVLKY